MKSTSWASRLTSFLPSAVLAICGAGACATPLIAAESPLPASITACASETDSLKRLICYDNAVARGSKNTTANTAPCTPTKGDSTVRSKHIEARIVRMENHPGEIVVQLDNDQTWQQLPQDDAVDPGLRVGDAVTIEQSFGSYWLSGHKGAAIKVRQEN